MTSRIIVRKGTYRDSITLMKISNTLVGLKGVTQAAVVMGTQLNKGLLKDVGFSASEVAGAGTDDLIIAIAARDQASLDAAIQQNEALLSPAGGAGEQGSAPIGSTEEALSVMPDANLALISVPGQFAKREALRALSNGLNVFLFSSNVSREDEAELKNLARAKNLLMMGPDCGTSIIGHKVLGFGNSVREGSVGLVSAAGTGLQEVSTLIHKAGLGITQAIGTGGGDLSGEVGGITMLQGLEMLEADDDTKLIVLISKPPAPKTMERILERVRGCTKPVVVNFLGSAVTPDLLGKRHFSAGTLEGAALLACKASGVAPKAQATLLDLSAMASKESRKLAPGQRYVRGLFAGGTLCYEAQVILYPVFDDVYSNAPLDQGRKTGGDAPSKKHVCIDMGAEEFVVGRPHPMIDYTLRNRRILREAGDPSTAVILLDVELGFGSNPDPAGQLGPVVLEAKSAARKNGRHLSVVASVVGTDMDVQGLARQEKGIEDAGVVIAPSNASASRLAALIASRGGVQEKLSGGTV